MKKRKYKLKKQVKYSLIIIIFIIIGIISFIKVRENYLYKQTYEYKFLVLNYTKKEIKLLEDNLDNNTLDQLLLKEKDETLLNILSNKFYHKEKLDRYIKYIEDFDTDVNDAINIVNINRDYDYYTLDLKTNIKDNELMIVNKYYHLDENYEPDDLVKIPTTYSWGDENFIRKDAYNAFINMWNDAKKLDIHLMINSAYRTYQSQEEVYNEYKEKKGEDYADRIAARPGYSEHQTGYALDIFELNNSSTKTFHESNAYTYLKENAYKFGFILRYSEEKENITGYNGESWHYRYIGKEHAKKVYELGITYDEYYENYLYSK